MRWAEPRYGTSYAIVLWYNQLRDILWLDLEVEDDFNIFKVECRKMYDIIAKDNKPYTTGPPAGPIGGCRSIRNFSVFWHRARAQPEPVVMRRNPLPAAAQK